MKTSKEAMDEAAAQQAASQSHWLSGRQLDDHWKYSESPAPPAPPPPPPAGSGSTQALPEDPRDHGACEAIDDDDDVAEQLVAPHKTVTLENPNVPQRS